MLRVYRARHWRPTPLTPSRHHLVREYGLTTRAGETTSGQCTRGAWTSLPAHTIVGHGLKFLEHSGLKNCLHSLKKLRQQRGLCRANGPALHGGCGALNHSHSSTATGACHPELPVVTWLFRFTSSPISINILSFSFKRGKTLPIPGKVCLP